MYGADAMAGVVNFVLKDNFEGVSMDMQTAMSEAGDGEDTVFSALVGMNTETATRTCCSASSGTSATSLM